MRQRFIKISSSSIIIFTIWILAHSAFSSELITAQPQPNSMHDQDDADRDFLVQLLIKASAASKDSNKKLDKTHQRGVYLASIYYHAKFLKSEGLETDAKNPSAKPEYPCSISWHPQCQPEMLARWKQTIWGGICCAGLGLFLEHDADLDGKMGAYCCCTLPSVSAFFAIPLGIAALIKKDMIIGYLAMGLGSWPMMSSTLLIGSFLTAITYDMTHSAYQTLSSINIMRTDHGDHQENSLTDENIYELQTFIESMQEIDSHRTHYSSASWRDDLTATFSEFSNDPSEELSIKIIHYIEHEEI